MGEHLEEHIEREEYIEPNEFQCVECNEFFSRDDAIKHENEGECDQCLKWLGCEKKVQMHKLKEHKIINKKVNKDSQETNNMIRIEKNELINGIKTKEKEVTERFKIKSENPERDNKTTNMQDQKNNKKDNKENQKMVTIKELESSKKEKKLIDNNIRIEKINCLKKIPSIVKPFTNIIEIVEENQKWDKDTTKRQDKIKDEITKDAPIDKSKARHKSFECSSPKEIKNFVNITLEKG